MKTENVVDKGGTMGIRSPVTAFYVRLERLHNKQHNNNI